MGGACAVYRALSYRLTTHEVVDDGVDGTVEVAQPVGYQCEVQSGGVSDRHLGVPRRATRVNSRGFYYQTQRHAIPSNI